MAKMTLFLVLAAAASVSQGGLVCRYDPDRDGNRIVLRDDGSIRFVNQATVDKDAVMKADIYRRSATALTYKVVTVGRTDIFQVSLKTLQGTQTLDHGPSEKATIFHLVCER